jgi:chromosome segregation ATPase
METWTPAILSIIGAIASAGLGGWIVKMYMTGKDENRKDKENDTKSKLAEKAAETKIKIDENAQAFEFMKEVVATMRSDLKDLKVHMDVTEKENADCREENAKRREENAKVSTELAIVKARLDYVEKSINEKPKIATPP